MYVYGQRGIDFIFVGDKGLNDEAFLSFFSQVVRRVIDVENYVGDFAISTEIALAFDRLNRQCLTYWLISSGGRQKVITLL